MGKMRVALFVTSLADLFRLSVGLAAIKRREDAGFAFSAPTSQAWVGLCEPGIKDQRRKHLDGVECLRRGEMQNAEVCSGLGGTFCHKYPDVLTEMASDKTRSIKSRHPAELLAGRLDTPAIGDVLVEQQTPG